MAPWGTPAVIEAKVKISHDFNVDIDNIMPG